MPIFKRCVLMASLLALFACGQQHSVGSLQEADEASRIHPLLGQWELCSTLEYPDAGVFDDVQTPYVALLSRLSFSDKNTGTMAGTFAKDKECKETLTRADFDAYLTALEAACKKRWPELDCSSIIDPLDKLWLQFDFAISYEAGQPNAEGIGTFDLTAPANSDQPDRLVTTYQTYKASEAGLQFSEVCLEEDLKEKTCTELAGDRPDNRATKLAPDLYRKKN